ncbi:hypothetical protein DAI22_08g078400 [Oryza sativa Japonica Group]|nr:hypothetical protein DAI22_08g078400 [Oryza sativa Japonica Group]
MLKLLPKGNKYRMKILDGHHTCILKLLAILPSFRVHIISGRDLIVRSQNSSIILSIFFIMASL